MNAESLKRYHCYLRAAGLTCREERDKLIAAALESGKDVLTVLHDSLVADCRGKRYPTSAASGSSCMKPAPFRFVWEDQKSRLVRLGGPRTKRPAENFLTGAMLWVLSAVRTR